MSTIFIDETHATTITRRFWQQCKNEEFCDVVLIAGTQEKRIPAHRSYLAAASEYFEGMFKSPLCESTIKDIKLSSLDGNALHSLIEYCYTGRVEINEEIVVELLKTADMLLLRNVVTACGNFLAEHLHPSNCLGFTLLAERYRCELLLEKAKDYSLEHFMEVYEMEEFLNITADQLGELLACDDLCVLSEEHVFKSLMLWIAYEPHARDKYKAELMKLVRLPLLEQTFLIEQVEPVCNSAECQQIYTEALNWDLMPDNEIHCYTKKSITARKLNQNLMAFTTNAKNSMFLHYYSQQQLKWLKCLKELEYRSEFAIATIGNNLYIIGGRNAKGKILNTAICLNLRTLTLNELKPMIENRAGCNAAVLNGFLYVLGGVNVRHYLNTVEKWDPSTNEWSVVAAMSENRYNFSLTIINEKLYAVGGRSEDNDVATAEYYDPQLNEWQNIAALNYDYRSLGIAVANGLLYAVGKWNTAKIVERYDPENNKWTMLYNLNESLRGPNACIAFQNRILIFYKERVEEYNILTNTWEECADMRGLPDMKNVFLYSSKLITSEFSEK